MTERLHPQDLRTIAAAILHAGTFAFLQGQQGQFTFPAGWSVQEADQLINTIDADPREPQTPDPGWIARIAQARAEGRAEGAKAERERVVHLLSEPIYMAAIRRATFDSTAPIFGANYESDSVFMSRPFLEAVLELEDERIKRCSPKV